MAHDGELYACSTAAGPAFEGARISQGCGRLRRAIDMVDIGADVRCHVLGDDPPRGLCGSGLVDAVAGLGGLGVVSESRTLLPPAGIIGRTGEGETARRRE